jgi:hypothetical protein
MARSTNCRPAAICSPLSEFHDQTRPFHRSPARQSCRFCGQPSYAATVEPIEADRIVAIVGTDVITYVDLRTRWPRRSSNCRSRAPRCRRRMFWSARCWSA